MHHFVEQSVNRLVPPVPPYMPAADDDLGPAPLLAVQRVMPQARLHAPRDPDRNIAQRRAEFCRIELAMCSSQLVRESLIIRVRSLRCTGIEARALWLRRFERERQLKVAEPDQSFQRSKQRCGPGMKFWLSSDQI